MTKIIATLMTVLALTCAGQAHKGFTLGAGVGKTNALHSNDLKEASRSGDANQYWIGYGFTPNLGLELSYDSYDFERTESKHQSFTIAGVYNFLPHYMIHPLVKLGLGQTESKDIFDIKNSSPHAKLALGLEFDFLRYFSVGGLVSVLNITEVQSKSKDAVIYIPAVYLALHEAKDAEPSKTEAPPAAVVKNDGDADGVFDDEDKCPNTQAGTEVNGYGCALTEKASVKLQVEFLSGKADMDSKYDGEIKSLADFMAKYPNTNVEIAGHTDNTGKAATNNSLSQKRAMAVKNALVKAGVDAQRLTAKGYGSSQPVADNKTSEGRQSNRRVMAEISVVAEKKK